MPAEVYFNDQLVGKLVAGERAELSLTITAALWNQSPRGKLELRFTEAVPRRILRRPRYEPWWGWALWKFRTEAVK